MTVTQFDARTGRQLDVLYSITTSSADFMQSFVPGPAGRAAEQQAALDKVMLGELINLISGVAMGVERVLVEMLEPFPDPAHGIEDRV